MAATNQDDIKKFNNWVDGLPSDDLQKDNSDSLGKFNYWVDGLPYVTAYPSQVKDFMPFFWGI